MRDAQEYAWQALRARPRWRTKLAQWIRRWLYRMGLNG
jgi:hypothetical protein